MSSFPQPEMHPTWVSWAKALIGKLSEPQALSFLQLRTFSVAKLPQANRNGLVVFVTDDQTGAQPVYSRDGLWYRFDGNLTET